MRVGCRWDRKWKSGQGRERAVASGGYEVFGVNGDSTVNGGVAVDYEYGSALTLANDSDTLSIGAGGSVPGQIVATKVRTASPPMKV